MAVWPSAPSPQSIGMHYRPYVEVLMFLQNPRLKQLEAKPTRLVGREGAALHTQWMGRLRVNFITILSLLAAAHCDHIDVHGGSSKSHHHQNDLGEYKFGYDIKDGYGNINGRHEKGSHGQVVGSYYLGQVDGRHRIVEYVADKLGFRATIKTNEPGTKTSEPAFAPINSDFGKTIPSGSIRVAGHEHHDIGHEHHDIGHEHHDTGHEHPDTGHEHPDTGHEEALGGHEVAHETPAYEHSHGEPVDSHHQAAEPAYHGHDHQEAYGASSPVYTLQSYKFDHHLPFQSSQKLNGGYRPYKY
ncbi:hypothetical protein BIW11_05121 [Tropilaelaps mercedesae]|uniref:Adult-specific rigid cuticular protein 15.7-like n=1 Tax=Tropilaelaps mercedesae TaxID=418985 RepID=A0A1V9Y3R1_9ACAR|nr:hypothetical protein BIW11_05121 [Tropilaelaps mercedesae]